MVLLLAILSGACSTGPGPRAPGGAQETVQRFDADVVEVGVATEDTRADVPHDAPADIPVDTSSDAPADILADTPVDVPADAPADILADTPVDAPADAPADTLADSAVDALDDVPTDTPFDAAADTPQDTPVDAPIDALSDTLDDAPTDAPVDVPVDLFADTPTDTAQDTSDGITVCEAVGDTCVENAWVQCDPETGSLFAELCKDVDACHTGSCQDDTGCVQIPIDCADDDLCTQDSCDEVAGCQHTQVVCDDGNPCTGDLCDPLTGQCDHPPADNLACDDGDPCTEGDTCGFGVCLGIPIECQEGQVCSAGTCQCEEVCSNQQCGVDACGTSCGTCDDWQVCQEGLCQDTYPSPPYGVYQWQTVANHEFLDPQTLETVSLGQYFGQGRLLLLDFSAGWCIVCKNDTAVFNTWLSNCYDDGLRVVQVLYENYDQTPVTQSYALGWINTFNTQYPIWMDTPTLGPDWEAEGGVLANFLQPDGPCLEGHFPIPMLIDTETMQIIHIDTGLNKAIFHNLITGFLGVPTCW